MPAALGQEGEFTEFESVRAIEVAAAIESKGGWLIGKSTPGVVSLGDLSLRVNGVEQVLTSIGETAGESDVAWQLLVYLDAALSSRELVVHAAEVLGANAERLAALGSVEIVLADPEPRRLLAPTSDAARIDEALSGLLLSQGTGSVPLTLRSQLRPAIAAAADERTAIARDLLAGEYRAVLRQQDRLLSVLAERGQPEPHRALLLVSDGFDLQPEAFYGVDLDLGQGSPGNRLEDDFREVVRAVAAYGWLTFAVQRPEPDPIPRRWGLRRQLLVRLDGNWDPEHAEAQLELGESLIRQKKWKRAEKALREAVYSFYDQPKRIARQAHVMTRLGFVLEQQGRTVDAQAVYRKALELDPTLAAEIGVVAAFLDPLAPLAELADATSGGVVRDLLGMEDLLAGLNRRRLLTFQLTGGGDSGLHEIELRHRSDDFEVLGPRWTRSATPPAVSAARARRLLDEELDLEPPEEQILAVDDLTLDCRLQQEEAAILDVELSARLPAAWAGLPTAYRVTTATPVGSISRVAHSLVDGQPWSAGERWGSTERLEIDLQQPFLALMIEELNTGRWLGALVECEETF